MTMELITANHAAGMAATLAGRANRTARGFGSGIYPITPQTECVELLSGQHFDKGHVVRVESEHSAMAVCIGFSYGGARSFTASSSNGLAYMTENVITAAMSRLPIVMMAVNRTLGPPWNIWADHGDTLMLRDAGWIQFYCEDNQEVFDTTLLAFRLAEDQKVMLPVLVCQDAFLLSHTMMMTDIATQDQVDAFLPDLVMPHMVTDEPRTAGGLAFTKETAALRRYMAEAFGRVWDVYSDVQDEFEKVFGRRPDDPVVPYRMDDAEVVIVSMATTGATAKLAVDLARDKGIKAGSIRVRMFRPFPEHLLVELLAGVTKVAAIDRDISPGMGGVLWSEIRGIVDRDAMLQNWMIGLGGGDIRPEHLLQIIEETVGQDVADVPKMMEVV